MGLATIDSHSQKELTEIHKIPKSCLVVIRVVFTEIQPFENVKNLQRNVWHPDAGLKLGNTEIFALNFAS